MADQKPKKEVKQAEPTDLEKALVRINTLEKALSKIATLSGNGNHLREFGLSPWLPDKKSMKKNQG